MTEDEVRILAGLMERILRGDDDPAAPPPYIALAGRGLTIDASFHLTEEEDAVVRSQVPVPSVTTALAVTAAPAA